MVLKNAVKKGSKYEAIIKDFIEAKVANPQAPISEFCEARGVKYNYFLRVLEKNPQIMATILTGVRKRYHKGSVEVDLALLSKAKTGDPRAIELWYKRMESWNIQNPDKQPHIVVYIDQALIPMGQRSQGPVEITAPGGGRPEIVNDPDETPCFELPEGEEEPTED